MVSAGCGPHLTAFVLMQTYLSPYTAAEPLGTWDLQAGKDEEGSKQGASSWAVCDPQPSLISPAEMEASQLLAQASPHSLFPPLHTSTVSEYLTTVSKTSCAPWRWQKKEFLTVRWWGTAHTAQ